MFGKFSVSAWVAILSAALIAVCLAESPGAAYRLCTFKGTVVDHGWRSMTVKSGGQCAEVNVGWRTKYVPNRRPCLGERVAVDFILEDGYMKATKVVSLSPPPPSAQCYPPPPPSSSVCRTVGAEERAYDIGDCPRPDPICSPTPPPHVRDPAWSPTRRPAARPARVKPTPPKKIVAKPKPPEPEPAPPAPTPTPTPSPPENTLTGEVVASSPKSLNLRVMEEGQAAEIVSIRVGLKTKFIPFRRPSVGEKVQVEYRQENGDKFGYTVKVIQ
ncbi:MAG: hypothetical protein RDU20_13035 [Desulfomonilaceae bacterium]|nr:hypothetical protein [Desulfomonilaceae bacterium]